jgi:hypothetical protein
MNMGRIQEWIRSAHLWAGMIIAPFLVLIAISAMLFNHGWRPTEQAAAVTTGQVKLRDDLTGIALARDILGQLGVTGEIDYFGYAPGQPRLTIPVTRPGERIVVNVQVSNGAARIEKRQTGLGAAILYLHKSPGPHNVAVRGNWVWTRVWAWLADGTVYLLLLTSVTGIYLWALLRQQRRMGLALLGAGCVCFAALVWALVA